MPFGPTPNAPIVDFYEAIGSVDTSAFDFNNYYDGERLVYTPALIEAGFSNVSEWFMGEYDSFGPLTRCVYAINPDGERVCLVYG